MFVKDIMSSPVITVSISASIEAAARIMLDRRISALPVVDSQNRLVGILDESDLLRRVELESQTHRSWISAIMTSNRKLAMEFVHEAGKSVGEVMSSPAMTIHADYTVSDAVSTMTENGVTRLFVQREQAIVGVIARADVVRALLKVLAADVEPRSDLEVRDAVVAELSRHPWSRESSVHVSVENGKVALEGGVFNEDHRKAVVAAARSVSGSKDVVDRMVWVDPVSGYIEQSNK
ncbi:CBS domain-containing protein [Rhizobium sp. S152]|uniref:CBS domain-containing protein n=1 Tax=Rhizobium sp. S152 TaxID=3055038 RepID=UPI0025A95361|nr:CBS domain-containing protein [Rhizobium sp. S152]MDM9627790.1 CBS domain-containing protein [Rhizobium sp. S152]